MAISANIPFTLVLPRVDWEILSVVIEGGWNPCILVMTGKAFCGELSRSMWWILCLVVIVEVTANTGIGSAVVVSVVTGRAIVGN